MGFILAIAFLSNQENLHRIHHNLDWLYDIYNTINEHKNSLPFIDYKLFWHVFSSESKSSFITSSASSLIAIPMLLLFESITRSSSWSIDLWLILHVSDFFLHAQKDS